MSYSSASASARWEPLVPVAPVISTHRVTPVVSLISPVWVRTWPGEQAAPAASTGWSRVTCRFDPLVGFRAEVAPGGAGSGTSAEGAGPRPKVPAGARP